MRACVCACVVEFACVRECLNVYVCTLYPLTGLGADNHIHMGGVSSKTPSRASLSTRHLS